MIAASPYVETSLQYFGAEGSDDVPAVIYDARTANGLNWQTIALGWRQLTIEVQDGVHRMEGTAPFGVMVHGYDEYVSYGYPAGLNVTNLANP